MDEVRHISMSVPHPFIFKKNSFSNNLRRISIVFSYFCAPSPWRANFNLLYTQSVLLYKLLSKKSPVKRFNANLA